MGVSKDLSRLGDHVRVFAGSGHTELQGSPRTVSVAPPAVGDTAATTIADMMRREQVFIVGFQKRTIGGGRFPTTPAVRQLKLRIEIDEIITGGAQGVCTHVSAVGER